MTTRQLLNRRILRGWLLFLALALAIGLTIVLGLKLGNPIWRVAILFVSFAAYLLSIHRTRCLQCHQPLGWRALAWIPPNAINDSPPCPHCGKSIDDETARR